MEQTMVKALTEIISVDIGENLVSMSVVEKENESGLKFNERLFIVVHGVFFGYMSKVKMSDTPNKINIEQAKVKVSMKNLYSVEVSDQIMTIKFTVLQSGKLVPKEWVIKTASAKMANFWKQLMEYQLKMRKASPKKQSTASPQKDKSKSSQVVNPSSPQKSEKKESKPVLPPKQQNIESSRFKKTAKVFQNPLFEDSDHQQEERPKRSSRVAPKETSLQKSRVGISASKKPQQKPQIIKKQEQKPQIKPQAKTEVFAPIKPETKPQKKPQMNSQSKSNIKQQIKIQSNHAPTKRQSMLAISLEKIQQQPVEDTPNIKHSRLSKSPIGFSKRPQRTPEKRKQTPKVQQSRFSQKFDLGIKQSEFMNTVMKDMDERNQRYPIQQLIYKHEDVQKIVKLYGKTLNQASNEKNKTEKMLEHILQAQKQKMSLSFSKVSVSEGSPWTYKQIVLDEVDNLINFRNKCKEFMKQLYMQVYNRQYSRFLKTKQQNNIAVYEIEDLQIKIPQIVFKRSARNSNINLLDQTAEQLVKKQFKYLKYLYKIIKNEDRIRVPYCCLCEYGGLTALFKAKCVFGQKQSVMQEAQTMVSNLQAKSKLSLQQFLKNRVRPLKELYYNDLRQGDTSISFKYCMITDLIDFFPCDLNNNNLSHERQLRMELIQKQSKEKLLPYYSNQDLESNSEARPLSSLSQTLNRKINKAIATLNQGSFYFLHPRQLSIFLHSQGINMRYLKTIFQKVNVSFIKALIASEMISRTIKVLLRKTLQDECLELLSRKSPKNQQSDLHNLLKQRCLDFLNCVFGIGPQTDAIWDLINKEFESKYQMSIQTKSEVSKGQLLISVAYHCNISLDWSSLQVSQMFNTQQFLKKDNIKQINVIAKSYQPSVSNLKFQLQQRTKQIYHQNFEYITQKLKLKAQNLPKELSLYPSFPNYLKAYLANFIEPQQLDWGNNYSHLSIYDIGQPSIQSFKIELCMLRWYLKTNKKQKYLNKFSQFSSKISKIYGNNHPLLSEMYQIFSDHHKQKGEVEDSINFMKSSLLNYSAIFGDQNVIVASNYYRLATLLIGYNRLYEAQQFLIKAKQIMDHIRIDKSLLEGQIRLSLAMIYFQDQKYKQSLDLIVNKVEVFQQHQAKRQNYENERTQIYQLLYYCQSKQNNKAECSRIGQHLEKKLMYFKQHQNFAEILCIIIDYYLNNLSIQSKDIMRRLIDMIPTKAAINYYKKAYNLLTKRYSEKNLFGSFKKYTQNAGKIVDMIVQKNLLKVWQNLSKVYERETLFDFISLVEELIYFIGRDRLNTI